MITYDQGDYHLGFIFQTDGSTLPKAACFALPSVTLAMICRFLLHRSQVDLTVWGPQSTLVWSVTFFTLSMLVGFRCNKAFARFWDGCELVQAMSAEWFESCSNLIAFSLMPLKQSPGDDVKAHKVQSFQFRLVHLMSLLHGVALRQVGGEDGDDIEVLDVFGLDEASLTYLRDACAEMEINRVEVILHWIQVLITESIYEGVLIVPPPILTRAYQTLSRGMVNLHNVRRIADIPFPFPLAQATVVLLIVHSIITPIMISFFFVNYGWCALVTFMPIFGCWNIVFVCGEMEQPFGNDDNDLPLSMQQFEFHTSLMMLVDDRSMIVPTLTEEAATTVDDLRERFGNEESSTSVLYPEEMEETETMREALRAGQKQRSTRRALFDVEMDGNAHEGTSENPSVQSERGFVGKLWSKMFGQPVERKKTTAMMKLVRANSMASSASGGTQIRGSTFTNYETTSQGGSLAGSRAVSKEARSMSKASAASKNAAAAAAAAMSSRKVSTTGAQTIAPPETTVSNGPSNVPVQPKGETIVTVEAHAIEVTQMQWQALPEPLPLPEPLGLGGPHDSSSLRPPKTPVPQRASGGKAHGRSRSYDSPASGPKPQCYGSGSSGSIQYATDVTHHSYGKRTMSWPASPVGEDVFASAHAGCTAVSEGGEYDESPQPCLSPQPAALPEPRKEPWTVPESELTHMNGVDKRPSSFGDATQHVYQQFRGLMGYTEEEPGAEVPASHAEKFRPRI